MFNLRSFVRLVGVALIVAAMWDICGYGQEDKQRIALAEGNTGIAGRYAGDKGIEKDPDVLFVEKFDEKTIEEVFGRWDTASNKEGLSLSKGGVPGSSDGQSLLVTHIGGGEHTGSQLYRRILSDEKTGKGYEQLYARFYVKFDEDCAPMHHFGTNIGGNNPPTRWPMVKAGSRTEGDKSFWTGIEPHGTKWEWDYYTYWQDMRSSPPKGQCWGNDFVNSERVKVQKGKWICVEVMMKMNSPATEYNGEQAFWIDGRLVRGGGQITSHLGKGFPHGKWIHDSWWPEADGEPFEGYRWRSTENLDVNYIWAYVYITKSPAGHVSRICYDNIVVAKKYIGPISQ